MNRIQKKCCIASTGLHLFLLVILFTGPAFLPRDRQPDSRPPIDFVPIKTIDDALQGGGNPKAQSPPTPVLPTPQPPAAKPPVQQPVQQPKEEPETPKPAPREPDLPDARQTKKLPDVSLKPVTRPKDKSDAKQKARESSSQTDAAEEQRKQLTKNLRAAVRNLRGDLSSSTTVEMPEFKGPGGGGVPYANFLDGVRKDYTDAWIVPEGVTDDQATAIASVTIQRDGTVLEAHILTPSGNALADQSVEAVLRRVRRTVPLPDGAKENQRTVKIKFNVKAKLLG
jgi:protein TonB